MKVVVSVLLAALAVLTAGATTGLSRFIPADRPALDAATAAAWVLAIAAFLALLRVHGRAALILVFAGSVAIGLAAISGPPNSTDSARYNWDGIVQNDGISPYAYAPSADALADHRVAWLFPAPVAGADGTEHCTGTRIRQTTTVPDGDVLCTALNLPHVPTIYPPVAEGFFAGVRALVPRTAEYLPLQVAGLLLSLGTTTLLVVGMRRRGLDARWAAVWGWSPFVAAEAVNSSHIDVLGVMLIVAATFLAVPSARVALGRGRAAITGVAIGLAAATKFLPLLAAPPLARRRPIVMILAALATFAVGYVPYIALSGPAVIGYLPGYLQGEGYDNGTRFALLAPLLPGIAATIVAAVLVLAALLIAWWRSDPRAPWHAQTILIGVVLLIVSPAYQWYALILVPFVALSRRWEWLAVVAALTVRSLVPGDAEAVPVLLAAAVIAVGVTVLRMRRGRGRAEPLIAVVAESHAAESKKGTS